eukprot:gb/GEZN01000241.1/.p1 GENE.gb/GEZN01000241.1/~~gb/GEZN01000241.1/.p1  ORF type:complete len:1626 (+),score=238.51 gb/GEZN01000241.1/:213-4880(+)
MAIVAFAKFSKAESAASLGIPSERKIGKSEEASSINNGAAAVVSTEYQSITQQRLSKLEYLTERQAVFIKVLQDKLSCLQDFDPQHPELFIVAGCNLVVINGLGSTESINSKGNIILGYNEPPGVSEGSHNLVIGPGHSYTSFGGLVVGKKNEIRAPYATVTGGRGNVAAGTYASVSGGQSNTARGDSSSVAGGAQNTAKGDNSAILGGAGNDAGGNYDTISGGQSNVAQGPYASISGGNENVAIGYTSSVLGGSENEVKGRFSTISGGAGNRALGEKSSVSGGQGNEAAGDYSSVSGGCNNAAVALKSAVSGGWKNKATNESASVSGGQYNVASGPFSSVSGGGGGSSELGNKAQGSWASVQGGAANVASGGQSSVSGGSANTASGVRSSAGGGLQNVASGRYSSTSAGSQNKASGDKSSVSGGSENLASGESSFVAGGFKNEAKGQSSVVSGGSQNEASGLQSSVTGGHLNKAAANDSVVTGGELNSATGRASSVQGGTSNKASGEKSSVSGGAENTASGMDSSISGGSKNEATGKSSSIVGGLENAASGPSSVVSGGANNTASGDQSSVTGGIGNKAQAVASVVTAGASNVASARLSSVHGGTSNEASGLGSSIVGGSDNIASGESASILGGAENEASATCSAVAGGVMNVASGDKSFVGGGQNNNALGINSAILGGSDNKAQGVFSTVAGGVFNLALGRHSSVGGGDNNKADNESTLVIGGKGNEAKDGFDVVVGGEDNMADGPFALAAGGQGNMALGDHSTVIGGINNKATLNHQVVIGETPIQKCDTVSVFPCETCAKINATEQILYQFTVELPMFSEIDLRNDCSPNKKLTIWMREGEGFLGIYNPSTGEKMNTTVWAYTAHPTDRPTLMGGPKIEMRRYCPLAVDWLNDLPCSHRLPIDRSLMCGAESLDGEPCRAPYGSDTRAAVHLHGGYQEWQADGHPEAWYTNNNLAEDAGPKFKSTESHYINTQEATSMFYHDHALGITRLNVYMGLSGIWEIYDATKDRLVQMYNIPSEQYETHLTIRDASFEFKDGKAELLFETDTVDDIGNPLPPNSAKPELFGDFILVNGMTWPVFNIEPCAYRFPLLAGGGSRFYKLQFEDENHTMLPFLVLATDQGVLDEAVETDHLKLAPADRYEIIIDFSNYSVGDRITLVNTMETLENAVNPRTDGRVMLLNISKPRGGACKDLLLKAGTKLRDIPYSPSLDSTVLVPSVRQVVLQEGKDVTAFGGVRVLPILGTFTPEGIGGLKFKDPPTETPKSGTTEIWEIINVSPDAHPIHLHLMGFRTLNTQLISVNQTTLNYTLIGEPILPDAYIAKGPKDVFVVESATVLRLLARWTLPPGRPAYSEACYAWHCHILSHEDNEMMRPLIVQPGDFQTYTLHTEDLNSCAINTTGLSMSFSLVSPPSGYLFQAIHLKITPFQDANITKDKFVPVRIRVALDNPLPDNSSNWILLEESIIWRVTSWNANETIKTPDLTPFFTYVLDAQRADGIAPNNTNVTDTAALKFGVVFTVDECLGELPCELLVCSPACPGCQYPQVVTEILHPN